MPGETAVDRDFDASHDTAALVLCRALDRDAGAGGNRGSRYGRSDGGRGCDVVGRGRSRDESLHERGRLHAHVGKQIDRGLLQVLVTAPE